MASNPNRAKIEQQISNAVDLLEEIRRFAHVNAENFLDKEDVLVQSLETDFAAEALASLAQIRADLNSASLGAAALLTPLFREYGRFINAPETDVQSILTRLYDDFIDNTLRVTSREFTLGTPAKTAGVGDGTFHRLKVDENGFQFENLTPETKVALCIADEHSGAEEHEEIFEVRGEEAAKDSLIVSGSGTLTQIRALSARDSLIGNASFTRFASSAGSVTSITNWTASGAIGNFGIDLTNFFRDDPSDGGAPASLLIKADDTLIQNLNVRRVNINAGVPVLALCRVNGSINAVTAGTFTLRLGSKTATLDMSVAPAGFNTVIIGPSTDNWFKNWNQEDPVISVGITGKVGGDLIVDDVMVVPMTFIEGTWYAVIGGATPFLRDAEFQWTDTEVGSKLQFWFWKAFGRFLPHDTVASGNVTWADP